MPRMRLSVEGRGKHLANQHEYTSILVYSCYTNAATVTEEIYLCIDFWRQLVLTKVFHVRLRVMACLTRLRVMACHTRLRVMACRVMSCTAACRSMRVNVDGLLVHGVPCRVMRPILPLRVVPCFPFLH